MAYKALYRTYRPHSFDTVVGQKHIVQTLQNAMKQNKISHAYLFCGPRGTGKTTVAKLVAKSVNCLNQDKAPCNECENCITIQNGNHPDVIEIDAASNNGVDEIRDLIEKVKYAPLQAKYKVYIIDEVHMLTQGAFNALLKTLEEPPQHVIFILATTEPHKVLPTIISRCQRYDFVRVNTKDIQGRIEEVLTKEKIKFESEATRLISQLADGGVRDALSILEQVIAYSGDELTTQHVNDIYGIATTQDKLRLLDAIIEKDVSKLMTEIEFITQKNIDIRRLTSDLMDLLKESIVYAFTSDKKLLSKLTEEEARSLNRIKANIGLEMIEDLMDTAEKYRTASDLMSYFEIGLLKVMGHLTKDTITQPIIKPVQKAEPTAQKIVEPIVEKTIEPDVENIYEPEEDISSIQFQLQEEVVNTKVTEVHIDNPVTMTIDERISLLITGDRVVRLKLEQDWLKIQDCKLDLKWGKMAHLLTDTKIRSANDSLLVVSAQDEEIVSELNSADHVEELEQFVEYLFGIQRHVIAMSDDDYDEAISEYKVRNNKGNLPEAKVVVKKIIQETKKEENTIEANVLNLFGEENVEII